MAVEDSDPSGIFAIALSDSEDDGGSGAGAAPEPAHDRTGQSEEEFLAVRRDYRVKVENGEIAQTIQAPGRRVTKQEAQALLHAVEEMYYFKRYNEGADFVRRMLDGGAEGLDRDTRTTLEYYATKCQGRMGNV